MRRAATPLFLATMFAAGFLASFPWADGAERLARASHAAESGGPFLLGGLAVRITSAPAR
jgi:hypothetical protein